MSLENMEVVSAEDIHHDLLAVIDDLAIKGKNVQVENKNLGNGEYLIIVRPQGQPIIELKNTRHDITLKIGNTAPQTQPIEQIDVVIEGLKTELPGYFG